VRACAEGHPPYTGERCWPCYKKAKRAANRSEDGRTKARGEPDMIAIDDDWRQDAACRHPAADLDADDWFANRQTLVDRARSDRAKAVCNDDCPVRAACLAYAVETEQPWGVWGGKTPDERGTGYHQQKAS
jgi:WhiB family redox-sensing transcriptional regulator